MFKGDIDKSPEIKDMFLNSKSIIILGNTGSGKTSLAFKILEYLSKSRQIYWIAHPKPKLLNQFGYECLESIEDIECLENSVIVWDELQLSLNISDRQRDLAIARALSLSRQRNNVMILITSDTRLLSPKVEAYLDTWCIKDIEYSKVKQRSQVRYIMQKNCLISPEGFKAKINELLLECSNFKLNGRWTYSLIPEWSEELSRPYANDINFGMPKVVSESLDSKSSIQIQTAENSQKLLKTSQTDSSLSVSSLSFSQKLPKTSNLNLCHGDDTKSG